MYREREAAEEGVIVRMILFNFMEVLFASSTLLSPFFCLYTFQLGVDRIF